MNVILKDGFTYTPNWNDNKKGDKDKQITVKFKFLSGSDLYESFNSSGKVDKALEWEHICKEVNNFKINGIAVDPKGLFNISGLSDLYAECYLAYTKETAISKKK